MPRDPQLAQIHMARKALKMDRETYIDAMQQHLNTTKTSTAQLSFAQRHAMVTYLKRKGWRPAKRQKTRFDPKNWRVDVIKKITALWLDLHQRGAVRDPSDHAMRTWCAHHVRADRLEWAIYPELAKCVEGLKSWKARIIRQTQDRTRR